MSSETLFSKLLSRFYGTQFLCPGVIMICSIKIGSLDNEAFEDRLKSSILSLLIGISHFVILVKYNLNILM
ncbi:uncharacterized protein B0P05DRAFT_558682 [Gilbertella persicaria]|uniref:uncharacterized protein n=1 Tax=Gilbertella persicaria TaxID=101096 RepID=UPI00221EFF61|nr:uncharacterized protein B0P05DRAFT_558682 [Gilbertella persicaria]KAI8059434.1 hypothetical protein B0P05DRAFT_558682 [Gilbertella persicaria]